MVRYFKPHVFKSKALAHLRQGFFVFRPTPACEAEERKRKKRKACASRTGFFFGMQLKEDRERSE